jgi:protein-disulfide isomerase
VPLPTAQRLTRQVTPLVVLTLSLAVRGISRAADTAPDLDPAFAAQFERFLQTERGQELVFKAGEAHYLRQQEKARQDKENAALADLDRQLAAAQKLDLSRSPKRGPADARVTIVGFLDFECPFCQQGAAVLDQVLAAYPKDVKAAFVHLPLAFHPEALPAARAAVAAGRQGKFWPMHDHLFAHQAELGANWYPVAARELGLDVERFAKDFADPAVEAEIKAGAALAAAHQLDATPAFLVNGVPVRGAQPLDHFRKLIDRQLAHLAAKATNAPAQVKPATVNP